jgi:hypothetical protein
VSKYRPGFAMIAKDAYYHGQGADLVITQERFPLAYRDPQVGPNVIIRMIRIGKPGQMVLDTTRV